MGENSPILSRTKAKSSAHSAKGVTCATREKVILMPQRVFSVGQIVPGDAAKYIAFRSDRSLFDADVIIFTPSIGEYKCREYYAGKPLISENDSQAVIRDCAHWRREIETAVDASKVVFVMLVKPAEVYYDTGQRTFSGTGRSRVTTKHMEETTSYESVPFSFPGLVPRGGASISVLAELGPLAAYWSEFGSSSEYELYFDPTGLDALLGTKNREKVVGGLVRSKGGGALVLLPPVKWDFDALTYARGDSTFWRKKGIVLGNRFIAALLAASDALRREGKRTPVPEWAASQEYSLPNEVRIRADVAQVDSDITALTERRQQLMREVDEAAELRALLYETGRPLEGAVLKALRLLGFTAGRYRDGESEFDAIFTSPEGRFLGEAEGKDSRALNIDKMSQLERNLQEDFSKENVKAFAKGVLFGNAFRLEAPPKRGAAFTDKCVTAAKRLGVALVRTPDLFEPARHLSEHSEASYATACRKAILDAQGTIVEFPKPRISGESGDI